MSDDRKGCGAHVLGTGVIASSAASRLRGLLGSPSDCGCILLAPCRGIHTYGMAYPIDVAFLDKRGFVLLSERNVKGRRKLTCTRAVAVLERPSDPVQAWAEKGDRIAFAIATFDERK